MGDGADEGVVGLVLTEDDLPGGERLVEWDAVDFFDVHHAIDDGRVVGWKDLHASGPIDLHGVVTRWVVAGRDHDAARALPVAHGERQLGRAAVALEEIDGKVGSGHDLGRELSELGRIVPCVVGDCTGKLGVFVVFADVVGQALGALADGTLVNCARADRIHPPTSSAGAKGDDGPKHIVERLPLFLFNMLGDLRGVVGVVGLGEPGADIFDRAVGEFSVRGGGVESLECRGSIHGGHSLSVLKSVGGSVIPHGWRGRANQFIEYSAIKHACRGPQVGQ